MESENFEYNQENNKGWTYYNINEKNVDELGFKKMEILTHTPPFSSCNGQNRDFHFELQFQGWVTFYRTWT